MYTSTENAFNVQQVIRFDAVIMYTKYFKMQWQYKYFKVLF